MCGLHVFVVRFECVLAYATRGKRVVTLVKYGNHSIEPHLDEMRCDGMEELVTGESAGDVTCGHHDLGQRAVCQAPC